MRMSEFFRTKKDGKRPLAVRIIAIAIVVLLVLAMIITMLPAIAFGEGPALVIDEADILTDAEEAEIESGLQRFREEADFDIVVLTVPNLGPYGVVEYADRFYDDNGYGGGDENDGALILVSTENRDWTMITSGYGITAITDYGLDQMEAEILPKLSGGDYAGAFKTFGDSCAYYVREARNGNIIDEYVDDYGPADTPSGEGAGGKESYPLATNAGIAGFIGILSSWLMNGRKKAELKSVRSRNQAREYMRLGSLTLTENRDRFLYKTVSRAPIPKIEKPHSSGHFGGSTIHMSPGGKIHGGGRAGKF